jgi:ribose 5-phosphate isomerase RpiB
MIGRRNATAALCRQHNNANIICLGAKLVPPDAAKKIVAAVK